MTTGTELEILKVGSGGDGVAAGSDGPIYVPFSLPGELVVAKVEGNRAQLKDIVEVSPARIAPICRHFTQCGGCACQHMKSSFYSNWKRGLIASALCKRGIETEICEMVRVGPHARRRATFSVSLIEGSVPLEPRRPLERRGSEGNVALGFHREGSFDVIDIEECPVLCDDIVKVLPVLRKFMEPVLRSVRDTRRIRGIRITVLRAFNGLDITITGLSNKLPRGLVARLSAEAVKLGALRVSLDEDPIYKSADPIVCHGPANVIPQPGAFLQASEAAEKKLVELIENALPRRAKRIADLFCGLGAFAFPMAARARISAFDTDPRAIDALKEASRHTKGIKAIEARVRDLFQEPLSRKELDAFDAVLFDPPRAGAKNQAINLAKSKVPVIIGVSCHPSTFARDARTLIDGGYSLHNVTPIDQFVYAAHVELVGVFRR